MTTGATGVTGAAPPMTPTQMLTAASTALDVAIQAAIAALPAFTTKVMSNSAAGNLPTAVAELVAAGQLATIIQNAVNEQQNAINSINAQTAALNAALAAATSD